MLDESMAQIIEEKLDGWKPKSNAAREPKGGLVWPNMNIDGEWVIDRHHDGSTMSIKKSNQSGYEVEFSTYGCLFHYRLQRTGEYSNGVLTLNRPVEEYFPLTYQKLYAVRIGGKDWLLPSAAVAELEQGLSKDGTEVNRLTAAMYLFTRKQAPTTTAAGDPAIQETREGSYSTIHITSPHGGEKVYRVDLSHHHSPASERSEVLRKWESYRLGAFVCFNTNQFTGEELCKTRDAKIYNPRQLDVAGWITAFKDAGMKYAVLTTRHTSGFLLWDSATTEFDVATSGNTTDVCQEFVKECRRQGLAPAFYYCLWGGKDWNPQANARAIILAQLYELATKYGEIPYFWLDMKNWAPADLSTQELYDELKTLQPECVVEFNQHVQDGSKIAYFPTDVVDGELTPPPATGYNPLRTVDGKKYYLPFDYNLVSQSRVGGYDYDPLGPSCWFTYGEGSSFTPSHPFPAEAIAKQVRLGRKRGANNALLATAPDHSGRMRPEDAEQLRRLGQILGSERSALPVPISQGCQATASSVWEDKPEWAAEKAVDGDSETRWGGGVGTKQGWLEIDLGSAKRFDSVLIEEGWGRIQRFQLQVKDNGQWRTILEGKEIGPHFLRQVTPTTARHVRLNILETRDVPTIWEFQLFNGAKTK